MKKTQLKFFTVTFLTFLLMQLALTTLTLAQIPMMLMSATVDFDKLNDPTKPPDFLLRAKPLGKKIGPLELTGIFIYPKYRVAIINGRPMMEGNKIGSFTIIRITPYTVGLRDSSNNEMILEMITPIKIRRE